MNRVEQAIWDVLKDERHGTLTHQGLAEMIWLKVADVLGHDHYVTFTPDGWSTEHSIECRLSGHMHECVTHAAIGAWAAQHEPPDYGRWKITDWTGDERSIPVLERADG